MRQPAARLSKHQPATPLPFKVAESDGDGPLIVTTHKVKVPIVGCAYHGDTDTDAEAIQDAEYLVHAANAYPKLIAALKNAESFLAGFDDCDNPEDRPADLSLIRALLRELGES